MDKIQIAAFRAMKLVACLYSLCYPDAAAGLTVLVRAFALCNGGFKKSRDAAVFHAKTRDCFERDIVAATDQAISGVPGRYAAALFELTAETNSVDQVAGDLSSFQTMMSSSPELQRMVKSPVFSSENQMLALEALCAKAKISGIALNFIKLIAKNRRLPALADAITAFHALVAESKGEVAAVVTSAEKLSPAHIKDLKAALKSSIGRDVLLTAKVDKSLLGGLIVKVGSKMMDNSLKTKLQNLKVAMKGTG